MDLAATHARALATMARNGAPEVSFRLDNPGTPLPLGGFTGASTTQVAGRAVRLGGATKGEAGETTQAGTVELVFVPDSLGSTPEFGSLAQWEGATYRVAVVDPVSPTGTALACYVTMQP